MQGVLLTSSGAVYGRQPESLERIPETFTGGPDVSDASQVYGEAKRMAELLGVVAARHHGAQVKVARCFAFVGPHLPVDQHFAAGNFIRNVLDGESIELSGDGTTVRSYLYAADLATWLWTILFRGDVARPYNVGSERAVSIWELAQAAAALTLPRVTAVRRTREPIEGRPPARYVPSVERARTELALEERIGLSEGLRRMLHWHEERRRGRRPPLPVTHPAP
jgi:dTDP-glucose 4,6-dehydratase